MDLKLTWLIHLLCFASLPLPLFLYSQSSNCDGGPWRRWWFNDDYDNDGSDYDAVDDHDDDDDDYDEEEDDVGAIQGSTGGGRAFLVQTA